MSFLKFAFYSFSLFTNWRIKFIIFLQSSLCLESLFKCMCFQVFVQQIMISDLTKGTDFEYLKDDIRIN